MAQVFRAVRSLAMPTDRARRKLERSDCTDLLQPSNTTWVDRHPLLFDAVRRHVQNVAQPRLLSFGCATGEEAFTLARYLPTATIDALDINPACIAQARRGARTRPEAAAIAFACASLPDPAKRAHYDAIFCLSVLRHARLEAEAPDRCDAVLHFDRIAAVLESLDRALRQGGLLVLWGCHFRFADTALAPRYRALPVAGIASQRGPFYGPDNRRLDMPSYAEFLFEKR